MVLTGGQRIERTGTPKSSTLVAISTGVSSRSGTAYLEPTYLSVVWFKSSVRKYVLEIHGERHILFPDSYWIQ